MKKLLFCCLIALSISGCGNPPAKTTTPTREAEQANPRDFLKVNYEVRKNLLGRKIVEGDVLNTGKNLSYSSVSLRIVCIKDGEENATEYTISSQIVPGAQAHFSYKTEGNPDQIKVTIASATTE